MTADRKTLHPGEVALARGALYRLCAQAFRYPGKRWKEEWDAIAGAMGAALEVLALERPGTEDLADAFDLAWAASHDLVALQAAQTRLVGHSPRGGVTPYETEWTGSAGELLQYHLLADLGGFYRAFGLELAQGCDERADHISIELAFLQFLCAKEALGQERGLPELYESARDGQRRFLAEHLLRWADSLCVRVQREDPRGFHGLAAGLLAAFLRTESASLGILPVGEALTELGQSSLALEDCCVGCELTVKCGGTSPPGQTECLD